MLPAARHLVGVNMTRSTLSLFLCVCDSLGVADLEPPSVELVCGSCAEGMGQSLRAHYHHSCD